MDATRTADAMHALVCDIVRDHAADLDQAMAYLSGFLLCRHSHPMWNNCLSCGRPALAQPVIAELQPVRESLRAHSPDPLLVRVRSHALPHRDEADGTPWYTAPFQAWIDAALRQAVQLHAWGMWWPGVEMDDHDETRDCGGVIVGYTWYTIKLSHGAHRYVYAERLAAAVHEGDLP
ncbi:hypothetical protein [Lentzea flaviverrucosa]|uniref:Uncharacterized protein n=1 Tax=Lentzea flaviverrucosa TaxID=200379 RepID=A0A1H9ELL3_9PSEU|nr:hypothetical protein [Lentzea flaviverrucosa]RDI35451.1 hypothetical protein DFR72_1011202 [Lentzea flaviverrucosa]SEQ26525.1 hypothetical protein SAMN05216195_10215 [Lentzea flaviverrucosa]